MCDQKSEATAPRVTQEAAKAYVDVRLAPQLAWYEKQAARGKAWHLRLTAVQIVATTAIPVGNVIVHSTIFSSVLAGVAALATGFSHLARHQEHWLNYRRTAGLLEAAKMRWEIGLPPYDGDDRHDRIVADGEAAISEESAKWLDTAQSKSSGSGGFSLFIGG